MQADQHTTRSFLQGLIAVAYPILITAILTAITVRIISPWALTFALVDTVVIGLILIAAIGIGSTILRLLGWSHFSHSLLMLGIRQRDIPLGGTLNRDSSDIHWELLLSVAIGMGALSLIVLLLGLAGFLHQGIHFTILALAFLIGTAHLFNLFIHANRIRQHNPRRYEIDHPACSSLINKSWWLLLIPFLVLGILAATNAPGLIWSEEGFGYDVLEYHLQMPKEYATAGRISFAPHNVYANFPANTEMLYLFGMILLGDPISAATLANFIHLLFAILTVAAAWTIGAAWSKRCAILCALTAASCGWFTYLSGLAYVENAMLFYGLSALAFLFRNVSPAQSAFILKFPSLLSGFLAGFACGCKYTAVPMIALPLIPVTWIVTHGSAKNKLFAVALFLAGTLLTFSPWLFKNYAFTGNPVFPLANHVFHAHPQGWGEEEQTRWDKGHSLRIEEQTLARRLELAWGHTVADHYQRSGPLIFLLAFGGLFVRRLSRVDAALLLILLIQLAVWLFATHLYARFAVVMLIPLILLAGRSVLGVPQTDAKGTGQPHAPRPSLTPRKITIAVLILLGLSWNFTFAARLHHKESIPGTSSSVFTEGQVPGFEYLGFINNSLPDDAKLLLIGDARPFYIQRTVDYWIVFNRHPFVAQLASSRSSDEITTWLRQKGYTHVLVHWPELQRLSQTYGLSNGVTLERIDHARKSWQLVQSFTCGKGTVDLYAIPGSQDKP